MPDRMVSFSGFFFSFLSWGGGGACMCNKHNRNVILFDVCVYERHIHI